MSRTFVNFKKQPVVLGNSAYEHIIEMHPEISIEQIKVALSDPDEVRMSSYKGDSELY